MDIDKEIKFREFSLKDYLFIIRLHLKKIIFLSIIGFCIGFYNNLTIEPRYIASSSVIIKQNPGADLVMDLTGGRNQDNISNAMQMIKSRIIAKETIKSLWPRYKNNLDLFGSYPFYPRGRRIRKYVREIVGFGQDRNPEKRMHYEEDYSDQIGNRFANLIENKLSVEHIPNTDIIKISYSSVWAAEAQLIVNTLTQIFKEFEKEINAEEAINAVEFLEYLVGEQTKILTDAEERLAAFQNKEQIYNKNSISDVISERIISYENKILENNIKINIGSEKIKFFRNKLTEQESELSLKIINNQNDQIQALRSQISNLEGELLINSAQYGSKHKAVAELNLKINVLKGQLNKKVSEFISMGLEVDDPIQLRQNLIQEILNLDLEKKSLQFEIRECQEMITALKEKLDEKPQKRLEFLKLSRNVEILMQSYSQLTTKLENARVTVASLVGKIQILDLASLPRANVNDGTRNILMGLLIGISFGFGIAFFIEFFDNSVRTIYDIEKHDLDVVGVIPSMSQKEKPNGSYFGSILKRENGKIDTINRQLITLDNPKSPISEAYRSLRTTLLYQNTDKRRKSLIVSSAGPGDGKTTTVANLAITLANMGKKTILIDTDLRRPVVNKVFGINKSPGITEYLKGYIKNFSDVVSKTKIDNLFIVPSGVIPPNPSELLGSKKLRDLIRKLEKEWDMVLFDSPPLVAVTDATMISKEIDNILIVVKVGKTEKNAFEHTINALKNISAPLGGIILNAVTDRHNYGYYYYYYQYYQYYGPDKNSA